MNKSLFTKFLQDEQGQDLVEYALLIAFISLAAVTMLGSVGGSINTLFTTVNTKLGTASTAATNGGG